MIKKVDHIAIVVKNIEAAARVYTEALGIPLTHIQAQPDDAVRVGFLPVGDSEIELVEPTSAETGVARFLERRGEALHHICLEVDDLEKELASLKERGVELIDEKTRQGAVGRVAFLHPRAANGILIELNQIIEPLPWRQPATDGPAAVVDEPNTFDISLPPPGA
ncbi:MAG: methylmalonyl-CoA epimerase [Chloroflexi bacterium]|nr:methylmalonyl-CoA epimerase [Chloroflexota bacterium]